MKKKRIGFDLTEPPPGWDPGAHETMTRIAEIDRALHELEREGRVESRRNPITGMREYRITERGLLERAKNKPN
jgi:hypothetical protein